jgi:peptidoglycan-N-acetylglucosamine deacetylase
MPIPYFHRTPAFIKMLYPNLIWKGREDKKVIFLSFDDGPVPCVTPLVLDILEKAGIKASFFCVGDNIRKYPEIFDQVINAGHSVGNHTYSHLNGWKTDVNHYVQDTQKTTDQILKHLPDWKPLFRPPYGRISRAQIYALTPQYPIVMWDVLSGDFDPNLSKENCLNNSIKATREGSIVVFHDSPKAMDKLEFALPAYISHFLKKGYKFQKL